VPLSSFRLPKSIRERFTDPKISEGVRAIAEMIRVSNDGAIRWAWPAAACEIFNHEGYREDLRLMQAWILVPTSMLVGILDTIRNRVLNFALEMESHKHITKQITDLFLTMELRVPSHKQ
jgi:hypothetical protein